MTRRFVRGIQDTDGCLQIREICGDGKCSQISQSDLDRRLAIERRHDAGAVNADRRRVLDDLVAELGGRCSACGEPIDDDVALCPICRQP